MSASLEKAVESIMHSLLTDKKGIYVGLKRDSALTRMKTAARLSGSHVLPLAETQYAPDGRWNGVVECSLLDEDRVLDEVKVVLLCDKHDKSSIKKAMFQAAENVGVELEEDEDEPGQYCNIEEMDRDLSVSIGQGVIAIQADIL